MLLVLRGECRCAGWWNTSNGDSSNKVSIIDKFPREVLFARSKDCLLSIGSSEDDG